MTVTDGILLPGPAGPGVRRRGWDNPYRAPRVLPPAMTSRFNRSRCAWPALAMSVLEHRRRLVLRPAASQDHESHAAEVIARLRPFRQITRGVFQFGFRQRRFEQVERKYISGSYHVRLLSVQALIQDLPVPLPLRRAMLVLAAFPLWRLAIWPVSQLLERAGIGPVMTIVARKV